MRAVFISWDSVQVVRAVLCILCPRETTNIKNKYIKSIPKIDKKSKIIAGKANNNGRLSIDRFY